MPELSGTYHTQYPLLSSYKKYLAGILARSPGIFRKMNQETQEMETLKSPPQPAGFLNICPAAVFGLFRSFPRVWIE
jgi:hypothetical protein